MLRTQHLASYARATVQLSRPDRAASVPTVWFPRAVRSDRAVRPDRAASASAHAVRSDRAVRPDRAASASAHAVRSHRAVRPDRAVRPVRAATVPTHFSAATQGLLLKTKFEEESLPRLRQAGENSSSN